MAAPFPHVVIRASAGTGKTFQLSNRFLGLACSDARPDAILATTFARKAAGEILERVLTRMAEAAGDARKLDDLRTHLKFPSLDNDRCLALLKALTRQLHRLRIGTLDSFFVQMAGSFGLELGLPPGWRIVDELEDVELRREAIRRVLHGESTADLVTLMNLLSKGEVRRSVAEQMSDTVDELYDLYCQTQRAAWHALPRHSQLSSDELELALATLEAIDRALLVNGHFANAHRKDVNHAQEEDWEAFVATGLAGAVLEGKATYYKKPLEPALASVYEPLLDHARAVLVGHVANRNEAAWRLLDRFHGEYQQLKFEQRALRFDDITRRLADGLGGLEADEIAHRLDTGIAHLLLDEFQDTSLGQWAVVKRLAKAVTEGRDGQSFFCVGDVKQAIYGWRGGVSEIFEAVGAELAGLEYQPLNTSYRSSQPVIDTVNRVFAKLSSCPSLDKYAAVTAAWAERFAEHSTARGELPGYVCLRTAPRAVGGLKPAEQTLTYAAAQVAELARQCPGRSIGVLVRRNQAVARLIHELRNKHQVRASEEGGNPLTDSPAVQLVLSAMTVADHPGDTAARFHVAHSPLGPHLGIPRHDDWPAAQRASLAIRERLIARGYGRTVYEWAQALASVCDERELSRLLQLVELAYEYDARATVRADDFVRFVEIRKVEDPTAADVRVMTVHQSKGLQFDIVVLPELDGRLPGQTRRVVVGRPRPTEPIERVCRHAGESIRRLMPAEFQRMFDEAPHQWVNESLCILYVAMTRAVHALHVILSPAAENERTIGCTFAGVLRTALTADGRAQPESLLYEHGDPDWHVRDEFARRARASQAEPSAARHVAGSRGEPLTIRLAPGARQQLHGVEHLSPSALGHGALVRLDQVLRLDNSRSLARGALLHEWLEQIEWLDDRLPDAKTLKQLAGSVPGIDVQAAAAEFREMLQRPAVSKILSRADYTQRGASQVQLYRERPFAFLDADALVRGTIDRLVVVSRGGRPVAADVIDFKSDLLAEDGAIAAAVERYRPQLEAYRRAAARMTKLPPDAITAHLVFLAVGIVRSV